MYFDSHAHYDDPAFEPDREDLLNSLPSHNITGVVNTGANIPSSRASIALAERYPFIYAAVGVHPHDVSEMKEADLEELRELCQHKKVVALGEIGLDYHYDHSPRDIQRLWFAKQLKLAADLQIPAVIHSREAAQDTMDIIKASGIQKGVLHCYSGHLAMALDYIKMGFYIGIGGVISYKNAAKTQEVAANIPLDHLLIETDAPYLSPVPHRGKRNSSKNLTHTVNAIAQARKTTPQSITKATKENACRIFSV